MDRTKLYQAGGAYYYVLPAFLCDDEKTTSLENAPYGCTLLECVPFRFCRMRRTILKRITNQIKGRTNYENYQHSFKERYAVHERIRKK